MRRGGEALKRIALASARPAVPAGTPTFNVGARRLATSTIEASGVAAARAQPSVPKRSQTPAYGKFVVPPPVKVPQSIPRPSYANHPQGRPRPLLPEEYAQVKTPEQINKMRRANGLAAEALIKAGEVAKAGVSTHEVDNAIALFLISRGGYPVGINYYGFPRGLCSSVNEVALHGIPNSRPLENGDIVNFDITVCLDDAYGDCSKTFRIGDVDAEAHRLIDINEQCLAGAIECVGPGKNLQDIGTFCQKFAKETGFGVVSEFCGHFIGSELHMKPNVMHVPCDTTLTLLPGMTFTIEPIFVEGGPELEGPLSDGWTYVSKSGGWSAQSEHTIVVTEHGAEILSTAL